MNDSIRFHGYAIAGVEPMTACTSRSFPRHTHDQYGFGVVDAGVHSSWSDRGQVEAEPGNLICVNPGEVHDGCAIGIQRRSWRLLYFDPGLMAKTCADICDGETAPFTFAQPVFVDDEARRLFDATFAFSSGRTEYAGNRMACETALLELVSHLRRHFTDVPRHSESSAPGINLVRDRIDADPAAPWALLDLARAVGLSRYQLIRGFARDLGVTPHAYILQRRIALARKLIRARKSLTEAAIAAGLYDQSHLTRCFVKYFGITPKRYALQVR